MKGKILVVDDNKSIFELFRKLLSCGGFELDYASNGEEAKRLMHLDDYNIVFSDLVMPRSSGLDVVLEASKYRLHPVIILMTAYRAEELEKQAMMLGAAQCIHKPLEEALVRGIVDKYIPSAG